MNTKKTTTKKITAVSAKKNTADSKAKPTRTEKKSSVSNKALVSKENQSKAVSVKKKSTEKRKPVAVKKTAVPETKVAVSKNLSKTVSKKSPIKETRKTKEILSSYSPEYLVLMQKDPNWLHAFWDIQDSRKKEIQSKKSKMVLRLYDVSSDLTVRKMKKRKFRDIEIPIDAKSWYIQNKAAENCCAVLGALNTEGEFFPVLESEPVKTFSFEGLTPAVDSVFFKTSIGKAGVGGFGSSGIFSATASSWLESLASSSESFSSGFLSSSALTGENFSEFENTSSEKDFFLWVKTRLIVYGGTRPDAHLQVRGEDFPLNPDGTFSLEMDLPDSTQVIPVFATDKDGDFPTTIVPVVVKKTQ